MAVDCLLEIVELPDHTLAQVLPRASARSLAYLLAAYPRTTTNAFLTILERCVGASTLNFLEEQRVLCYRPSLNQIRRAEAELIQLVDRQPAGISRTPAA